MNRSASFRSLTFEGYSRRITMLMPKIEKLLCTRIDVRMVERLLALKDDKHRISATQQALAADLATAREVFGRTLNSLVKTMTATGRNPIYCQKSGG
jgi:CRP/FNR family transcriptional regulator, anaerobic regulatory protein